HDRDDVCRPGRGVGGAADWLPAPVVRRRRQRGTRSQWPAGDDQSGDHRTRRHAARGRRLPQRAWVQCDGRPAVARRRQGARSQRDRVSARRDGPAGACVSARDGPSRRATIRRTPARREARDDRPEDQEAHARRQMVTSDPIKVVFFGTPAFAVPTLDALLASRYPVVAVVTQPDRPRGRGQKVTDAPVKARARAAGLPVLQPDRLKDAAFSSALHELHADLGVVAAYGKILTDEVLAIPPLGMINVHASLLPKYRGAAPV